MAARIRAWLAREDGMTIPELLTAMSILAFVVTGILVLFVGGLNATTQMNARFQAQQDARLALSSLRYEVGFACSAVAAADQKSVQLLLPDANYPGVQREHEPGEVVRRLGERTAALRSLPAGRHELHRRHWGQEG